MIISLSNFYNNSNSNISYKGRTIKYKRSDLKKMVEAGKSLKEIAEFYEIKTGRIRPMLKRMFIKIPDTNYRRDLSTQAKQIESLIMEDKSLDTIAQIVGVSKSKLSKWIKDTYNYTLKELKQILSHKSTINEIRNGKKFGDIVKDFQSHEQKKDRIPLKLLRLTKSDLEKYLTDGKTIDEIAKIHKTHAHFIRQVMEINHVYYKKGVNPKNAESVLEMIKDGKSIKEISAQTGISWFLLNNWLKNVKQTKITVLRTVDIAQKINERKVQGYSIKEIATELKMPPKKVYYYLRKHNLINPRIKVTKELLQNLISEGKTHQEIAEKLEYTPARISQLMKRYGLKNPNVKFISTQKESNLLQTIELAKQGYTVEEIARKLEVTPQTICKWKKVDIGADVFTSIKQDVIEKKREMFQGLINAGFTNKEIAELFRKSYRWIGYTLKQLGLKGNLIKPKRVINIDFSKLVALKEKGLSQADIAKELGVSESWVYNQFKKARLKSD